MNADDKVILTGFGIALLVLLLLTPYLRRVYLNAKRPLAERYADDINAGRAIIVPADPRRKIKAVIYVALGTTFILLQRQLNLYIAQLDQTCVGFYGWNSWFLRMGNFYAFIYIFIIYFFIIIVRRHRQVFRDGYAPQWPYNTDKAHIAFKLTPKLKLKWRLELCLLTIACVVCWLSPFLELHIFHFTINSTTLQQFHTFNDRLQADCRKDLHKQSLNPTSATTPSPATSPPVPATVSTRP